MKRILSTGLAVAFLLVSAEKVLAQSSRLRVEPSARGRDVQTSDSGEFFETSLIDSPTIVKEADLFTVLFRTGIVFRARCHFVIYDPCPELRYLFRNQEVMSSLAQRSQVLLNRMLKEKGLVEQLEKLTVQKIRDQVQRKLARGEMTVITAPGEVRPHEHPHEHDPRFPPPDGSRLLLGTALFAGGGVLSATHNEWAVDEGYVGVAIAAAGLYFMFREFVPEWRRGQVRAKGANMSIAW